ncbi:MAG: apolipoprotein N-acyltransferase, partial [Phycisphaerae bacterium]|nr:apolipoprotein N-acyltransferase [Phycisphaerae bacterium]
MIADPAVRPSAMSIAGLIALSVILLSVSFAPLGQFYFAWFALAPFFVAMQNVRSQGRAMLWGWLGGLLFFGGNMWWLTYVTVPGMFALVGYLALYWGFAAMLVRGCGLLTSRRLPIGALLMAAGWTALDFVRGSYSMFGAHGLPWLYLGDTQTPFLTVCQIADITGVYGVTFLIVLVNMVIARAWLERRWHCFSTIATAGLLMGTIGYGIYRIKQPATFSGPTVLVIQPNYPQSNSGDKGATAEEIVNFHVHETKIALNECAKASQHVDLVVWSETMMPPLNPETRAYARGTQYGDFLENTSQSIANLANEFQTSFLVGATFANDWQWVKDADGRQSAMPLDHRNSAYLYNDVGLMDTARYDKIQLLPFGEFVPFRESIPWLYRLLVSLGPPDMKFYELTAGQPDALTVFKLDVDSDNRKPTYRFVVPICFEDIVSPLVTDLMRSRTGNSPTESARDKRADFLVNITNDGWFRAGEQQQHLQAAVFRSIENRVPTARSVNSGVSGFIDSLGHESDL